MEGIVEKVCPNCGCNRFYASESVRQTVIIEGDGSTVERYEIHSSKRDEQITCIECEKVMDSLDSLVTEAYFHENIATQEEVS